MEGFGALATALLNFLTALLNRAALFRGGVIETGLRQLLSVPANDRPHQQQHQATRHHGQQPPDLGSERAAPPAPPSRPILSMVLLALLVLLLIGSGVISVALTLRGHGEMAVYWLGTCGCCILVFLLIAARWNL